MSDAYICLMCERTEDKCECHRYCNLCQGEHNVRLCRDGQYYCNDCREVCDMQAQG